MCWWCVHHKNNKIIVQLENLDVWRGDDYQGGKVIQPRLERDFNTSNTKDMWQVIQTITGYKSKSTPILSEAMFPDKFNIFYCSSRKQRFSCQVYSASRGPATLSILLRANVSEAAEPDKIPVWVQPWFQKKKKNCLDCNAHISVTGDECFVLSYLARSLWT